MNTRNIKHTLLIGNGINLIPEHDGEQNTALDWQDLIMSIFENEDYRKLRNGFIDLPSTSYPLKFERIINYINNFSNKGISIYLEAKQIIIQKLKEHSHKINNEVADALRKIPCSCILTTNYDTNLEQCFRRDNYEYSKRIKNGANNDHLALLRKTTKLKAKGRSDNESQYVDFYHIHGINSDPKSICLGYIHYSEIISILRSHLVGNQKGLSEPKIIHYLNSFEDESKIGIEYPTRFFDSDIAIIGLGLGDQEIDLWWILSFRASLIFTGHQIGNKITYYDVHTEKKTPEGYSYESEYQRVQENLFKNMAIEYRPYLVTGNDTFKSKYLEALGDIDTDFRSKEMYYPTEANNWTI